MNAYARLVLLTGFCALWITGSGAVRYKFPPGEDGNYTSCGVTTSLRASSSDPNAQSPSSTILISSSIDPNVEYLCSAGYGYDITGIYCYSLKCPAYGYDQRTPYPNPYAPPQPGYGPQKGPYQPAYQAVTVGAQIASVETTYPCWKIRQLRLNTYVYIVCFIRGYASTIYQVNFKENYQITFDQVESIFNTGLSGVGRVGFTTEKELSCLVTVFSSYHTAFRYDQIREPSDILPPIYHICPNNYKWYYCGNLPVTSTVDASMWLVHKTPQAFLVAKQGVDSAPVPGVITVNRDSPTGNYSVEKCTTPIVHFSINPDVEEYVCRNKLIETITNIGCSNTDGSYAPIYPLCGINKANVIYAGNMTFMCASVNVLHCCNYTVVEGQPRYSSFCMLYDTSANQLRQDKVVFLRGSDQASDLQYVRGHSDACQYIFVTSPTKSLRAYCLSSLVAAMNNVSTCGDYTPGEINPTEIGKESHYYGAESCSYKSKCCGSSSTCVACTRPAKFYDKYLSELSCGSDKKNNYDDSGDYPSPPARNPYGQSPQPYGRPGNYTQYGPPPQYGGGQYGPPLPPQYGPPGYPGLPPPGNYAMPYQAQYPPYGAGPHYPG
ncbi:uncharacterized protein LOC129584015 [Paramacrobiotus metropolitanus]|uniref:uncharacterized protein LOC129584015 n=1 Tax=Paramacrobiotus metropolitanus TaxID=2943436 RepID=UPI002446103D|nr:uncharacterized protein LOC129584015 [Paramacrobiotus metropolitanus]